MNRILELVEQALSSLSISEEHGCIVLYIGIVKKRVDGKQVTRFRIEVRDRARLEESLRKIQEDLGVSVAIIVQEGVWLKPGEPIAVVCVAGSTRDAALRAVKELVDMLKDCSAKEEHFEE